MIKPLRTILLCLSSLPIDVSLARLGNPDSWPKKNISQFVNIESDRVGISGTRVQSYCRRLLVETGFIM